ncbi:MAG: FAD-binding oxidoreductase [Chloroflexota bacterium]|nr:FAD-binding oxidoreductase [Chloroflexota bacterium]
MITVPDNNSFPRRADVVVIGGGIVGVSTAFYTSRAGLDTILLEMRDGLATLTTAASAETFHAQLDEVEMIRLVQSSIEIFERFSTVIGLPDCDIGLHQQGCLFISSDPDYAPQVLQARVEFQHSAGLEDVEFLDGADARRRFPFISPRVTAATYRAKDGWLSSHQVTYGFAKGSQARFLLRTRATNIKLDGKGVCEVETERGTIHTRTVVIAAGPFSGQVSGWVGVELPLQILRLQKVVIADPAIPQDAPMTIDWETGCYWRPEVGGGMLGWADPDELETEPAENVLADRHFPALVLEQVSRLSPFWKDVGRNLGRNQLFLSAGQQVCVSDGMPVLGPVPGVEGLFLNAALPKGVMAAPAAGRYVAEMITGQILAEDNPFGYERLN